MKKILLSILTVALFVANGNTNAQSCCKKPTGKGMQALALNKSFKAAHEAPLPINYSPEKGSMIQFPVAGGKEGNAFFVPATGQTDNVLFVFHEWWGLNDYIKKEAEHLQTMLGGNVDVYAIDLYDGNTAVTPDEASKLMSGLDPVRAEAIINGAIQKIGKKNIATIGWCMGGSWSFTGAVLAGPKALGCVMYYGFPEKNAAKIKPLRCDVLYVRANQDGFIKAADVTEFGTKVKVTGHGFDLRNYDAVHAFANPSNPKYDAKAAGDAEVVAIKFLKTKLTRQ
ncbi:MAG: dienelactone hydrolase family protein [Flavipsychrobacter sp.]|nr:dienelactone hydrolase family protein [Flavipsychrobacter sp.]